MKIAFDLDGTLWAHPDLFKPIIIALMDDGHEVGILTAHQEKRNWDIEQMRKEGLPDPEFYIDKPLKEHRANKAWKLSILKEHNIDYLFDDFDGYAGVMIVGREFTNES